MFCTDPFVAHLKSYGYNVVRLPKADIKPLQVLSRQGRNLGRLGDIADVMNPGGNVALPMVTLNNPAANISGQRTSDMSIGLGLNILATIIGATYPRLRQAIRETHAVMKPDSRYCSALN